MLKLTCLDADNTQNSEFYTKSDFFQTTTFELKVCIQTFAETSDQSGRTGGKWAITLQTLKSTYK